MPSGEKERRRVVYVKGHDFREAADHPAWCCIHCGLMQGESILHFTFGWCRR